MEEVWRSVSIESVIIERGRGGLKMYSFYSPRGGTATLMVGSADSRHHKFCGEEAVWVEVKVEGSASILEGLWVVGCGSWVVGCGCSSEGSEDVH